ncbi:MAG: bifunctional diaminohydroxyphosphoribosylaminopyrimidine deaminase/5-amino-6-(5-phosphoribosylamino)uracil reductase RibD [Candidatus Omnitrophota bacterium]
MEKNDKYMDLALRMSLKAKGLTSPNPLVGAVVVKNNKIVSTGFHKRAGLEHAEIVALKKAKEKVKGAYLYVTLEPCSSFGKTPPCTEAIIKSGIKKVIIGMIDPNPEHRGRAIKIFKKHNINVASGILKDKIREINQPFIKYIKKNLPYITLKVAQTLDGKIATKIGDSRWVTSLKARKISHKMRRDFDAIMVGINTILNDNPLLNLDKNSDGKKFYKIILDTNFRIRKRMRIFNDISKFPVIIATSNDSFLRDAKKIKYLVNKGVIVLGVGKKYGVLDTEDLLKKLAYFEITNILVEGGGQLAGSLFDNNLVDKVLFFISPKIIGGKESISSVQGLGIDKMAAAKEVNDTKIRQIGKDLLIEGVLRKY